MAGGRGTWRAPQERFRNVSECGPDRSPQIPADPHRSPQIPTDPRRPPQIPTDPHRSPQTPTDPYRLGQGICSPSPSPIVLVLGRHNSVSPCGARGPPSRLLLKCPRTGLRENCRPVRSSLLGSFPVGPPGPPEHCEHCLIHTCFFTISFIQILSNSVYQGNYPY